MLHRINALRIERNAGWTRIWNQDKQPMDWNIAVLGPVGAGKSTSIRSISDIPVVDTDVQTAQSSTSPCLDRTTVAIDIGVMALGSGDQLRLLGAPGNARFDYMDGIVLEQAMGVVIMIDHRRATRLHELENYWHAVQAHKSGTTRTLCPVAVAVTHSERHIDRDLALYQQFFLQRTSCTCNLCQPPVLWCDARQASDVAVVLVVMAAMLESMQLYPESVLHQRMSL